MTAAGKIRRSIAFPFVMLSFVLGVWLGHGRAHAADATMSEGSAPTAAAAPLVNDAEIMCPDGTKPIGPTSPPPNANPPPGNDPAYCDWYGQLAGRADCQKPNPIPGKPGPNNGLVDKLLGYETTCQNMTKEKCPQGPDYATYTNGMRYCLQKNAANNLLDMNGCVKPGLVCQDLVNQVASQHNPCNAMNGFCGLSCGTLGCFGAAIGNAWGGWLIGTGTGGPTTPIGPIATVMQVLQCQPAEKITITSCMCKSYQNACFQRYRTPNGEGGGVPWKNWINWSLCVASCPTAPLVERPVAR